jgi:hypothetical protein
MNREYSIVDSFTVRNSQVLVLNEKRDSHDYDKSHIMLDGVKHKFTLTHNEQWIIVEPLPDVVGKKISFLN